MWQFLRFVFEQLIYVVFFESEMFKAHLNEFSLGELNHTKW